MVDGAPDRGAFVEIVGAALGRVRAAGYPAVRLYGEMVDLLCQRDVGATLRLEALWNEVLTDRRLSLLCAYRLDPLERPVQGLLRQVTQCHSRLLPAEHPERLEHAVDRAYAEVFGAELPPMSRAHATMLTLGNLSGHIASELSARARAYYRDRTNGVAT